MFDWKKKSMKVLSRYRNVVSPQVYQRATYYLDNILCHEEVSWEIAFHCYLRIFPIIALYQAYEKKDAYHFVSRIFWDIQVIPGTIWMRRLMKIPGVYQLIPRLAAYSVKSKYKVSGEGFQYIILESTGSIFRVDFHQCPYYSYCLKYGVPELCDIFCTSDEIVAAAMAPKIIFEREKTLARGGDCCDFCYRLNTDCKRNYWTSKDNYS